MDGTKGSITIDTRLDNRHLYDDFLEFEKIIDNSGVKTSDRFKKQLNKLQDEYNKFLDDRVTLLNKAEEAMEKYQNAVNEYREIEAKGVDRTDDESDRYSKLYFAIINLKDEYQDIQSELEKHEELEDNINSKLQARMDLIKENFSMEVQNTQTQEIQAVAVQQEVSGQQKVAMFIEQQRQSMLRKKQAMEGLFQKLKRYTFYLLGIRTVYSAIMKSVNSWFSKTEEGRKAQEKLQGVWISLGQTIGPIVGWLIDKFRLLLGYLNEIVKMLFNFSLFSKNAAKNMGTAAQNAAKLRKQLAGFDEMNVLSSPSSGSSIGDVDLPEPDVSWIERLKPMVEGFIAVMKEAYGIIKDVATWLWDHFIAGLEFLNKVLGGTDEDMGKVIGRLVLLYAALQLIGLLATANPITWIIIAITAIIIALGWLSENWEMIKEKFNEGIKKIKQWFIDLWEKITNEWKIFKYEVSQGWDNIKDKFWTAINFIKDKWDWIVSELKLAWNDFLDSIVGQALINTFAWLLKFISDSFNAGKRIFGGFIDFIVGIFTGDWERAWKGVVDIFGGLFDSLAALAKIPINFVITHINSFIRNFNKIKIPDWVPVVGGKSAGIKEIPLLQKGAFVTGATTAIIGEAGREAVIPLDRNLEWADQFLDVLDSRGGMGGGMITNIIQIDGKEVARQTKKLEADSLFNRNGRGLNYV